MISYSQFLKSNSKFFKTLIALQSLVRGCMSVSELKLKLEVIGMKLDVDVAKALFDISFGIEEQTVIADFKHEASGCSTRSSLLQFIQMTTSKPICKEVNHDSFDLLLKMMDDKSLDWLFMSGDFQTFVKGDRKTNVYDHSSGSPMSWKQGIHFASVMFQIAEGEKRMLKRFYPKKLNTDVAFSCDKFFQKLDAKVASYSRG